MAMQELPIEVQSSNGRPINDLSQVKLFNAGTEVLVAIATYKKGSAGRYEYNDQTYTIDYTASYDVDIIVSSGKVIRYKSAYKFQVGAAPSGVGTDNVTIYTNPGTSNLELTALYKNAITGDSSRSNVGGPGFTGIVTHSESAQLIPVELFYDDAAGVRFTKGDATKHENNAVALKQAIHACRDRGYGGVLLPDAFYCDELKLTNADITRPIRIVGNGTVWNYKKTNTAQAYQTMIQLQDCEHVTIEGVHFHGQNLLYSNGVVPIKTVGLCKEIAIRNCIFEECSHMIFGRIENTDSQTTLQKKELCISGLEISGNLFRDRRRVFSGSGVPWINNTAYAEHFNISNNKFYNGDLSRAFYMGYCRHGLVAYNYAEWGNDSDYYARGNNIAFIGNYSWANAKDAIKNIGFEAGDWPGAGQCIFIGNTIRGAGRTVAGSPVGINVEGDPAQGGGDYVIANNLFIGEDPTLQLVAGVPTTGQTDWANPGMIGVNVFTTNVLITNNHFKGMNSVHPTGTGGEKAFNIGINLAAKTPSGGSLTYFDIDKGSIHIQGNRIEDMIDALIVGSGYGGVFWDNNVCRNITDRAIDKVGALSSELSFRNSRFYNCSTVFNINNVTNLVMENCFSSGVTIHKSLSGVVNTYEDNNRVV